jgi:quercetin dioxygenase-like cupin family protein
MVSGVTAISIQTIASYGEMGGSIYIAQVKRSGQAKPKKRKHFHNSYEIFFLVSGNMTYFIDDRTYAVREGDLVFINKNLPHRTAITRSQYR